MGGAVGAASWDLSTTSRRPVFGLPKQLVPLLGCVRAAHHRISGKWWYQSASRLVRRVLVAWHVDVLDIIGDGGFSAGRSRPLPWLTGVPRYLLCTTVSL